jgi:hypothetical protein
MAQPCDLCSSPIGADDLCTSCFLHHGDACRRCGHRGLHAPACTSQRLLGDPATHTRRPITYGIAWPGGGRIDRRWSRDDARVAVIDHLRRARIGGSWCEAFELFADGTRSTIARASWDVGAGRVAWVNR